MAVGWNDQIAGRPVKHSNTHVPRNESVDFKSLYKGKKYLTDSIGWADSIAVLRETLLPKRQKMLIL